MKLKKNIAVSETGFLFDPNTGDSFSLNETGKAVISLLEEGKSEEEIFNWFTKNYEVDKANVENNYRDFISVLQNFKIID